jgi:TatD DNase family protein
MFVDTHLHFSSEYYDNLSIVYQQALDAGVEKMIASGCDSAEIKEINKIVNEYQNVFVSVGYHPSEKYVADKDIGGLRDLIISNKKIVAIGEIGLDYYYDKDEESKKYQQQLFIKQLNLAAALNKPVIIHMRDATEDTIKILSNYSLKGVIHCFTGSYEVAQIFIKLGYKLGIGGVVTFKNSHLSEVIEKIALEDIVLETDSPYLSPEPLRGQLNKPANLLYIAKKIAEIKKIDMGEVGKITTNNAYQLFDLSE